MGSEAVLRVETDMQAAPARARSRPVDLVHLSRHTLGDRALEREVLELFRTQSAVYLGRSSQAHTDREWKEAAHSLKGSAQAIGAWRTAEAARQAEALGGGVLVQLRALHLRGVELAVREAELYIRSCLRITERATYSGLQRPRRPWHPAFNCPIEHGPRAGMAWLAPSSSGARVPLPGSRDRNTKRSAPMPWPRSPLFRRTAPSASSRPSPA